VLISSHVLSEVAQTVDDVVVIHHGRLVDEGSVDRLSGPKQVSVRSPRLADLAAVIERAGAEVSRAENEVLLVSGLDAAQVGELAFAAGLPLHELAPRAASLEEVFLELTTDAPQDPT
jgi:ABC-2 type transport system ATP-binding protein